MSPLTPELHRRQALRLLAASLAAAGLGGCDDPASTNQHLVPAAVAPPGIVPGVDGHYASAATLGGPAIGIVVTHRMGRPVKIEGNPAHPASLGATDAVTQALILDFYDPDRAGGILRQAAPSDRIALEAMLAGLRPRLAASRGAGFRILTGPVYSPSIAAGLDAAYAAYPELRWHETNEDGRGAAREGSRMAYGAPLDLLPRLDQADLVVGIDSDLLDGAPGHLRHAHDMASRRNPTRGTAGPRTMSRVVAIEPAPTHLGALADDRFVVAPADVPRITMALADAVFGRPVPSGLPGWVASLGAELRAHHGRAFIHLGGWQPDPALHALVLAMNEALGGRGALFNLIAPVARRPEGAAGSLRTLVDDMQAGHVQGLLVLDADPVFTTPDFVQALRGVPLSLHAGPVLNDTAVACTWHVPLAHPLEAWGDARAHDGTATILQPQSLPLYGGTTAQALLSMLVAAEPIRARDAVRRQWQLGDEAWRAALSAGVIPNTGAAPSQAVLRPEAARAAPRQVRAPRLDLLARPDPYLAGGRLANNAWLQELPRAFTKIVWDNPLLLAPLTAGRYRLRSGDTVRLSRGDAAVDIPVWILPGMAENVAYLTTGQGRRVVGQIGQGVGTDVNALVAASGALELVGTGHTEVACTEHHAVIAPDPDGHARQISLADLASHRRADETPPALYQPPPGQNVAWGMSIDLNACTGCNACVVACQAENNIATVGREEVLRQREMHWLRIDRYWDQARPIFQPVLCMHCEEAPCETVCPVGATVHDHEGLNLMVYNRCVGTRFCSNNCPYKVRRFNYFDFSGADVRPPESWNPEVTVRARGVMEKCTFCVQRIAAARIAADIADDPARERGVVTACQAACPTRAISFGDKDDPTSEVAARKRSPLDYALLEEQSTRPRVTYETRIRNTGRRT